MICGQVSRLRARSAGRVNGRQLISKHNVHRAEPRSDIHMSCIPQTTFEVAESLISYLIIMRMSKYISAS